MLFEFSKKVNYMLEKKVKKIVFVFVALLVCMWQMQAGEQEWERGESRVIQFPACSDTVKITKKSEFLIPEISQSTQRDELCFSPWMKIDRYKNTITFVDDAVLYIGKWYSAVSASRKVKITQAELDASFASTIQASEDSKSTDKRGRIAQMKYFFGFGYPRGEKVEITPSISSLVYKECLQFHRWLQSNNSSAKGMKEAFLLNNEGTQTHLGFQSVTRAIPEQPIRNISLGNYECSIHSQEQRRILITKLLPRGTAKAKEARKLKEFRWKVVKKAARVAAGVAGVIGTGAAIAYLMQGSLKSGQSKA